MKTIVVISDTHGNRQLLDKLDPIFAENDYIIHLGDTSSDGNYIRTKHPEKTYVINGNCDVMSLGESEKVISVGGVKIFACHGHRYSVKSSLHKLAERAKSLGCNIALYGHTHRASETEIDGVTLLNPGAGKRYGENSYLYIVINGGKAVFKTVPVR